MNRADFLKRLGLGAIGIVVAPKVISNNDIDNPEYKIRYLDPPNVVIKCKEEFPETDTCCVATTEEPDWDITEDKLERAYMMQKAIDNEIFLGKTMG